MRPLHLIRAGIAGAALLFTGAADQVPLSFSTTGGDAWDFSKSINITVPEAAAIKSC
jgi:cyclomaltodextrinase / maltogenic alpha-amylase / neopullulanase